MQKRRLTYLLIQLDHPQVVVGLECGEEEDEEEHHGNHAATPDHYHHDGEDSSGDSDDDCDGIGNEIVRIVIMKAMHEVKYDKVIFLPMICLSYL